MWLIGELGPDEIPDGGGAGIGGSEGAELLYMIDTVAFVFGSTYLKFRSFPRTPDDPVREGFSWKCELNEIIKFLRVLYRWRFVVVSTVRTSEFFLQWKSGLACSFGMKLDRPSP